MYILELDGLVQILALVTSNVLLEKLPNLPQPVSFSMGTEESAPVDQFREKMPAHSLAGHSSAQ